MSRCIVNVATGRYVLGQERLRKATEGDGCAWMAWANEMPAGCPPHSQAPYAFKAFAMQAAADAGHTTILWADASIRPIQPLDTLWERIERDGYWISDNGWINAEWTAESAYQHLGITPEENWQIPHVVATAFGLDLRHMIAREFLAEYLRLSTSGAFAGPWWNRNHPDYARTHDPRCAPCGPANVRGHRHDQTIASVLAWRLGMKLTKPPAWFAYAGGQTPETVLLADGGY